jgi:glutathione reductase (NADPH)
VTEIAQDGDRLRVAYRRDGKDATVAADRVVNGAGRVANVDGLDLDAGGVRHNKGRVEVDDCLRSVSNPAVWVCGDALAGTPQLSPLATYEGKLVGRNIAHGAREPPDYRTIPSCVYTVPALASVGLTQAQAEKQGLKAEVSVNDMRDWFSGETYGETVAWAKVLTEAGSGRILGAQMVGHSGEELIHLFALAMRHDIPAAALKSGVFAFPTFSAEVGSLC